MRRFEIQDVVVQREVEVARECNGCGASEDGAEGLTAVVISVNEGEEGGAVDELDYCDDCLVARSPALEQAGSTAFVVTGREPTFGVGIGADVPVRRAERRPKREAP